MAGEESACRLCRRRFIELDEGDSTTSLQIIVDHLELAMKNECGSLTFGTQLDEKVTQVSDLDIFND